MKRRIAVAISGGVDSSVTAYLLQQLYSPYADIIGLHMNNWNNLDEDSNHQQKMSSCYERDAIDAQNVCNHLNIRMHRVSFASEYWINVFEPFLHALEDGLMPNPDVGCNSKVKFGAMRNYAMNTLKADFIATGHYAQLWHRHEYSIVDNHDMNKYILRTSRDPPEFVANAMDNTSTTSERSWLYDWGYRNSIPLLLTGADEKKDQSYFLAGVKGEAFRNVLFPIGHLMKNSNMNTTNHVQDLKKEIKSSWIDTSEYTVRSIASLASLPTANKRDSMGICFIGKRKFSDFVNSYLSQTTRMGQFIDIDTGMIVGRYKTSSYFTIGQGSKISGASRKWFIAKIDKDRDIIYVCSDTHHPSLYSSELYVKLNEFNWICGEVPPPLISGNSMPVFCRIRHLQPLIPSEVIWDRVNQMLIVRFHRAVRAVTAGQMCVLYAANGTVCLGGGAIWKSGETYFERKCPLPKLLHPSGSNDLSVDRIHESIILQ